MFGQWKTAVEEVFGPSELAIIFFECNDHDTVEMGRRLVEVLGLPVEYKNLSVFYKNPAAIIKKYDLIITTYHHLAEITAKISELNFPTGRVVGIDTRITADTMLRIARFPNPNIGVVCTNQTTAHMLKHILYGYHPEWQIEATTVDEPEKVKALGNGCNHLVVTHTCADEVTAMTGRSADVVVNFQIDEQSIDFLNQRIHQIRMERMSPQQVTIPEDED
jgi:GntR family transcriptional regulator